LICVTRAHKSFLLFTGNWLRCDAGRGRFYGAATVSSAMPADVVWRPIEIRDVVAIPKTAYDYATLHEKEPYQGI
jgi:hypothetical protein